MKDDEMEGRRQRKGKESGSPSGGLGMLDGVKMKMQTRAEKARSPYCVLINHLCYCALN